MKKILLTLAITLSLTAISNAQSKEKIDKKINNKIERVDSQIVSVDKDLALTEDQKEKIRAIEVKKFAEIKKAKKDGASKDELQPIYKKYGKQVALEVLTKEQRKAKQKAKK